MIVMCEIAPGRYVRPNGERVRFDPDCPDLLLADYDVTTRAQAYEAELAVLRLTFRRRDHIQASSEPIWSDDDMAARKRASGKPWTEEQYREAGIELLHLRMRPDVHEALDELAGAWGLDGRTARADAIRRAIAEAHARHVAPYARGPVEQPGDESFVQTKEPLNNRSGGRETDKSG